MEKAIRTQSIVDSLKAKFEGIKADVVKKSFVAKELEDLYKSKAVLTNQITLLRHRLSDKTFDMMDLAKQFKELQEKYILLETRYMRQEGLWEKAISNADTHALDMEKVVLSTGFINDRLYNGLTEGNFGVLTAKKITLKPFDYSIWEVLYVDGNRINSVEIKRMPNENQVEVISSLVLAKNLNDILEKSIYPVQTTVGC